MEYLLIALIVIIYIIAYQYGKATEKFERDKKEDANAPSIKEVGDFMIINDVFYINKKLVKTIHFNKENGYLQIDDTSYYLK